MQRMIFGGFALALLASSPSAQNRHATSVVAYNQGSGGGIFATSNVLGAPEGGGLSLGSLDVLTLGFGGDVTLGFDVTITNGPGADFTVYENPFVVGGTGIFAEYANVEVSTDGVSFARFPWSNSGASSWGSAPGLAGGTPGLANAITNSIDPFDPVVSGGDSFDLAELSGHPLVLSGAVDLSAVHYVRLVDAGGADIDAVSVIQHAGNQAADAPSCDLWRDAEDFLHVRVSDPDGLANLDPARTHASLNLAPLSLAQLREFLKLESSSATHLEFVSRKPIGAYGVSALLAVSVADRQGSFSGDQISVAP